MQLPCPSKPDIGPGSAAHLRAGQVGSETRPTRPARAVAANFRSNPAARGDHSAAPFL